MPVEASVGRAAVEPLVERVPVEPPVEHEHHYIWWEGVDQGMSRDEVAVSSIPTSFYTYTKETAAPTHSFHVPVDDLEDEREVQAV